MSERQTEPMQRLRRRRRLLGSLPVAVLAWGGLAGLPTVTDGPQAGTVHTEIITLTGAEGEPTAAVGASTSALRNAPQAASNGWTAQVEVEPGTQAVAASWLGAADGVISVRGRTDGGWSEWTPLESAPQERPDDAERYSGGMSWFGIEGIDAVEVRVDRGPLVDLEVQPIRYEEPTSDGGGVFGSATAGASATAPTILPRSSYTSKGWASGNPGCASGPVTASGGVRMAVIHHTVNSNTYASADVPAMLAAIYSFHTGTNRWCDTGYNFIIDRFGRTWEGRSGGTAKAIVGGHAAGFNTSTVGISFLGQYEPGVSPAAVQPAQASLTAAAQLIGWKLGLHGHDPTATASFTSGGSNKWPAGTVLTLPRVVGHRDVGYTACPGQNVYDRLASIRTAAKAAQGSTPTTTTTTPTGPPPAELAPFYDAASLVTQQYRDVLRREPSADDLEFWTSRVGSTWTAGQFIAHITASSEADDRVHTVTRLYRAYFLRNPDYSGLTFWLNRRGEGRTLVSISQSFATSSEFVRRYGSLSNAGFVDRVYRNVLGRAPDANGLTYWTSRLNTGTPRGQVMASFSQSSEFIRSTNGGVQVVGVYAALVQRMPAAEEYELLEAAVRTSAVSLTSVASFVYGSDEYRDRFS